MILKRFLFISLFVVTRVAAAQQLDACFAASAKKYNLDPRLLWSIAMVESRGRASAINLTHYQRTNSVDLGIMQINSGHLPTLARYGITRDMLMNDSCLNIDVGAWILADSVRRNGATWNAVGAYNTACSQLKGKACEDSRRRYTDLVWKWYAGAGKTLPAQAYVQTARAPAGPAITIEDETN
ncbi:lytic transglycosylase domain-containing protein [Noviherbaspirillum galbum]|uniref:Lytic transglycosylase domain-containing protein n=1 Tax=Noviherbaspirillum galbum TaxID=2709383 RepID=A0A6B3SRN5_9BURK|nr:lytic transglycosylase domain-containing protein [Noviherbaspirillum galbum]NEX63403.1 lytic transglycosylase domain-containing protein [Noviherbaspirillum galbum]